MSQISRHFSAGEWRCKDGSQTPPAWEAQIPQLVFPFLEPLRAVFGATTILSGFRSSQWNREVGGAPRSMHLWLPGRPGVAADVKCAVGKPIDWYRLLDELGAPGLGLYSWGVHVDSRRGRARW